ncbi:MAG TPA: SET domain-containing protein-lysine N-methyltransferase [Polyangiaceae bacterium]|nr:SET domain-containing protein-lysine N-methyltransferase [Polyangiaceae bacterium]
MLHPAIDLKLVSPDIGYGVFATQDIPKGTIIWALDPLDQIIDQGKAKSMKEPSESVLHRYSWINGNGDRILCWDFGRFMNHSCEPNSVGPGKLEFEIAVRDIKAGEEVVCDYGSFNLEEPLDCACGSAQCRGRISPEDVDHVAPKLDELVRAAFREIPNVTQPLWGLVQKYRLQIERGIAQPSHLPSLLENRWPRVPVAAPAARARRASR